MRSHESDVTDGALKVLKGAWLIERVTVTVGPSSLSQSPENAVGGAYMTRTGRGRKSCRETASLASGATLSPLHLGVEAGGGGSQEFKDILHSIKENIPNPHTSRKHERSPGLKPQHKKQHM